MPSFAFSYYRIQVVDGPVNILVIGPDGRVRGPLSQALSFVARNASAASFDEPIHRTPNNSPSVPTGLEIEAPIGNKCPER